MARTGENIFKRKDGRWEARYIKGYDMSGKSRYGFCYGKTYREVKEKANQARIAVQNQAPTQSNHDHRCFSLFCDEWLALQRGEIRESTFVKYGMILEKHVKPQLGKYNPLALNTKKVEDFKWELLDVKDLSPKTVKDVLRVLRAITEYTAKQFPNGFPALEFHYPKIDRKEIRVLSPNEQHRLISCLLNDLDECRFGILLSMLTGIRLGELCALRWEHISIPEQTIHICATLQRLKNLKENAETKTRLWIDNPKSNTSCRVIPIS